MMKGGGIAQKVDKLSPLSFIFLSPFSLFNLKVSLHHLHLWPVLHMFDWLPAPCNINIPGMAGAPTMLCCSTRVSVALQTHTAAPAVPPSDAILCRRDMSGPHNHGSALSATELCLVVDTAALPDIVCALPRRSRSRCLLNYSIWKVCEVCFAECDGGTEGKVFTYSFILLLLLLHSRKSGLAARAGAGGNRKWMLSAGVPMETLQGKEIRSCDPVSC